VKVVGTTKLQKNFEYLCLLAVFRFQGRSFYCLVRYVDRGCVSVYVYDFEPLIYFTVLLFICVSVCFPVCACVNVYLTLARFRSEHFLKIEIE
jgi:hypothetical protein